MSLTPPQPPRVAERLAAWCASPDSREFLVVELRHEFERQIAEGVTPRRARWWYWSDVVRSTPQLLRERVHDLTTDQSERTPMLSGLRDDIYYAIRLARRTPLATGAVILTMAISLGATAALWAVVDGIVLRPLPFAASDQVVRLSTVLRDGQAAPSLAVPDLRDIASGVPAFSDVVPASAGDATLIRGSEPRVLTRILTTDAYARVFASRIARGRFVQPEDLVQGAAPVIVVTDGFWRSELGASESALGSFVSLDDARYEVVGILEPGQYLHPDASAEVITPLVKGTYNENRGSIWVGAVARLKPGVTPASATKQLAVVSNRLERDYPDANANIHHALEPLRDTVIGPVGPMLTLLAVAIAAVVLIACVNIGNLLSSRATARAQELAIRAALGGSRARLQRQLLTESVVLALTGGIVGIAIAPFLIRALVLLYPAQLPRVGEISINISVVAVTVSAIVLAGLLAGLPAMRTAWATSVAHRIRAGSVAVSARGRSGNVMIVTQLALSLVVLSTALLLGRTFMRLSDVAPGYRSEGVVTFRLYPSPSRHQRSAPYFAQVEERLTTLPGVASVSTAGWMPLASGTQTDIFFREEIGDRGPQNPMAQIASVGSTLISTLGLELMQGRWVSAADDSTAPKVAVIDETLAKRFYSGVDPIGRFINWSGAGVPHVQIVGVVRAVRSNSLAAAPTPTMFVPITQVPRRTRYVAVHSTLPPEQAILAIRSAVRAIDSTVAITDLATMDHRRARSLAPQRFRAVLMAALSLTALALCAIGIYAVASRAMARRAREIAIRIALGATPDGVFGSIIARLLVLGFIAAVLGAVGTLWSSRLLSAFMAEGERLTFDVIAMPAVLVIVLAVAGTYAPARRASGVDPAGVLRETD